MNISNLTERKFQYQGQLDQDLEEWLYPRGSQPDLDLISDEEKQGSTDI